MTPVLIALAVASLIVAYRFNDFRFYIWRHLAADILRHNGWGPLIAWDYTGTMRDYFDAGALPVHAIEADRHVWEFTR